MPAAELKCPALHRAVHHTVIGKAALLSFSRASPLAVMATECGGLPPVVSHPRYAASMIAAPLCYRGLQPPRLKAAQWSLLLKLL